jgi:hypothetical protein
MNIKPVIASLLLILTACSCSDNNVSESSGDNKEGLNQVSEITEKNTSQNLDESNYELLKTRHNSAVQNFHLYVRYKDYDEKALQEFIDAYKAKYCTMACNINLYDDKSIADLIGKYPLEKKEYLKFADHFIATASNDSPEVWMYPYQDTKYKEYGGRNWKKEHIK